MSKALKYFLIFIAVLILVVISIGLVINEQLPTGKEGMEADILAENMLVSLNKKAYESIEVISWTFPGGHHYVWNKSINEVNVKWDDYEVNLNTKSFEGTAIQNGRDLEGEELLNAKYKAWKMFVNDSFWLIAPYKVFDPGTSRKIVDTEEGKGLLVKYSSGGVTPGDSYLWILDENYRPIKWKMWVQIIPVGGLELTWEGWVQKNGAWFALEHKAFDSYSIKLTNLECR